MPGPATRGPPSSGDPAHRAPGARGEVGDTAAAPDAGELHDAGEATPEWERRIRRRPGGRLGRPPAEVAASSGVPRPNRLCSELSGCGAWVCAGVWRGGRCLHTGPVVAGFLAVVHLLVAAAWFGAMSYSLGVVQPRARRFFADSPQTYEDLATTLAAGARWKVIGMLAVLAATGVALVAVTVGGSPTRTCWWWALIVAKAGLLLVASVVFWHVSWRMWPRRVFALPEEQPAHQRAFLRVGWTLAILAGAAMVLGTAAATLGR